MIPQMVYLLGLTQKEDIVIPEELVWDGEEEEREGSQGYWVHY